MINELVASKVSISDRNDMAQLNHSRSVQPVSALLSLPNELKDIVVAYLKPEDLRQLRLVHPTIHDNATYVFLEKVRLKLTANAECVQMLESLARGDRATKIKEISLCHAEYNMSWQRCYGECKKCSLPGDHKPLKCAEVRSLNAQLSEIYEKDRSSVNRLAEVLVRMVALEIVDSALPSLLTCYWRRSDEGGVTARVIGEAGPAVLLCYSALPMTAVLVAATSICPEIVFSNLTHLDIQCARSPKFLKDGPDFVDFSALGVFIGRCPKLTKLEIRTDPHERAQNEKIDVLCRICRELTGGPIRCLRRLFIQTLAGIVDGGPAVEVVVAVIRSSARTLRDVTIRLHANRFRFNSDASDTSLLELLLDCPKLVKCDINLCACNNKRLTAAAWQHDQAYDREEAIANLLRALKECSSPWTESQCVQWLQVHGMRWVGEDKVQYIDRPYPPEGALTNAP